jgi:methylenetetrahydrofolate dehydrogenase (NADP+)/methenyltetrahydrofolate cyclohydrolase
MSAQIIDGKAIAAGIRLKLKQRVSERVRMGQRSPGLAVILVGDNPASEVYVASKRKACAEVGIVSLAYDLPADVSQERLLALMTLIATTPWTASWCSSRCPRTLTPRR